MVDSGVEVYADIVFLINLSMDFFILWIVSILHKKRTHIGRIIIGAAVASLLYCLIIFVPGLDGLVNIFGSSAIIMIAILITFNPKRLSELIKLTAFTYIGSFAVGGVGLGLFYFTNIGSTVGNYLNFTIQNFSLKLLLASTATVYITIKLVAGRLRGITIKRQTYMQLKISLDGKYVEINALVDTGNSLIDPLTEHPVIIAEFMKVRTFLPDSVKLVYYEHREDNVSDIAEYAAGTSLASRIRLIPFTSVGTQKGVLVGFKPDRVEMLTESKETITCGDVIIGIYNCSLSKEGIYQALVNPELISRRRING